MRLNCWNTKPIFSLLILVRPLSLNLLTFLPAMKTSPLVGTSKQPIIFSRVDFPEPEGPIIEMKSPAEMLKFTLSNAFTLPLGIL